MRNSAKSYLLASACCVAMVGAASAADIQLKAPVAALPVATWTGPYIAGHVGVASSLSFCTNGADTDLGCNAPNGVYGTKAESPLAKDTRVSFGAEVGYDWQQRYFVYGVAADWTWTGLKKNSSFGSGSITYQAKIDWLASFRGRMGLAVDTTLVYITGGLALGGVRDTASLGAVRYTSNLIFPSAVTLRKTQVGWVAGVGVEHKFSRTWAAKVEYLHYDLGSRNEHFTTDSPDFPNGNLTFAHTVDTVRASLVYRWY